MKVNLPIMLEINGSQSRPHARSTWQSPVNLVCQTSVLQAVAWASLYFKIPWVSLICSLKSLRWTSPVNTACANLHSKNFNSSPYCHCSCSCSAKTLLLPQDMVPASNCDTASEDMEKPPSCEGPHRGGWQNENLLAFAHTVSKVIFYIN